jgi:DNA-binding NtrC family response regulator
LWAVRTIRSVAAVALVVIAGLGGGLLALSTYSVERDLSVGRIELSVQPFHGGALDIYVPLVDWGARFSAVRLPARLSIDVRTVDREAAQRVAAGQLPDVEAVRHEARDALASYLRELLARHDGNVSAAAKTAGIDRKTFHRLINKYHLK